MLSPGDQVLLDGEDYTRRVTITVATRATDPKTGNARNYYVATRNCDGEKLSFFPDRISGHWVET